MRVPDLRLAQMASAAAADAALIGDRREQGGDWRSLREASAERERLGLTDLHEQARRRWAPGLTDGIRQWRRGSRRCVERGGSLVEARRRGEPSPPSPRRPV